MIQKRRLTAFALLSFLSLIFIFVIGWKGNSVSFAQDGECTPMAQSILESVRETCEAVGRDQICYGSVSIEAEAQNGAAGFSFEQKGDIANVADLATLRLQALDPVNSQWGVALIKVQASLPDSTPEDVTLLLFGNVQIANLGTDLETVEMAVNTASNVRNRATAENTTILGSISSGESVIANGRMTNPAGENWIRIKFESAPAGYGWVLGVVLTGDTSTLKIVESSTEPAFGPMEAFTFTSQDDETCGDVSNSGLMIQTPAGVGEINFFINEVDIQVGSTAFFTAEPNKKMTVSTLEGAVKMEAFGANQNIPPGAWSTIPLNEQGKASGMPELPSPYAQDEFMGLISFAEIDLFPDEFDLVEPFDAACLEDFNSEFNDDVIDTFGDEVSTACFLRYNDLYKDYYLEDLAPECFDNDGNVSDECLVDFENEWPAECYDESGEISEYCQEPDKYLDALPDYCYRYDETIQDECLAAFDNIDALPDQCFDEVGAITDDCFGASGILFELPESCYANDTGDILDECLDSFGSFSDFSMGEECYNSSTGSYDEACLDADGFYDALPAACFDPDSGEVYEACYDPFKEYASAPDDCFDSDTGFFNEECYGGIVDDDFGYGTTGGDAACDPNLENCGDLGGDSCDPNYEDCGENFSADDSCDPNVEDCGDLGGDSCDPNYEDCGNDFSADDSVGADDSCDPDYGCY